MADAKITELTALTTPAVEDVLAIVDDPAGTPVTKKITTGNLTKQILDVTAKTANYTLTTTDRLIFVDATAGDVTISVPAASSNEGIVWTIKKIDSSANAVIIDPDGSETIDGDSSYSLTQENQVVSFTSDNSNIVILSEKQGTLDFKTWIDYVAGFKIEPTLNTTIASGDVYNYVYESSPSDITYYRLVPNSSADPDAFYTTFSGGILSGEIVRKGITL